MPALARAVLAALLDARVEARVGRGAAERPGEPVQALALAAFWRCLHLSASPVRAAVQPRGPLAAVRLHRAGRAAVAVDAVAAEAERLLARRDARAAVLARRRRGVARMPLAVGAEPAGAVNAVSDHRSPLSIAVTMCFCAGS